ncbi:MAG TPA: substrate-binding domain-containing protein [Clostridia bacterium]|nr:substrate-binding domain-containing protein [Clostridia bacterium]
MKKAIALLLFSALLCGATCLAESPAEADPEALWARIDGSTATIPLSEALFMRLSGQGQQAAVDHVKHNKTPIAYENLIEQETHAGEAVKDLIFVTPPSEEELEYAALSGVELELIPIAKDAIVFLNNRLNSVEGLTAGQIREIYTGQIGNWADVGGNDASIIPFRRQLNSGSETLFRQVVLDGLTPMNTPTYWLMQEMGEMIDQVASYDNAPKSIGYSVYYYVHAMYGNENIRMMAVDGVLPTHETIAAGAYPFCSYYYAVVRRDLPEHDPLRALVAWLLTDEGQALVRDAGYVPLRPLPDEEVD